MALVKCPECGKDSVSDSAISCPECGYAIQDHFYKIRLEEQRIATEKAIQEKQEAEAKHRKETEGERQKETIKRLESQIKKSSKEVVKSGIGLAISLSLTILCWCLSSHGSLGVLIVICAVATFISGVFLISSINEKNTALADLERAKRDINEYESNVDARIKAYTAQSKAYATKNVAKHPKCPMCGSLNTERIGTLNRAASVATVGLASSKIGKQYQCKNCKHKW